MFYSETPRSEKIKKDFKNLSILSKKIFKEIFNMAVDILYRFFKN